MQFTDSLVQQIRNRFKLPLPGEEAQYQMATAGRLAEVEACVQAPKLAAIVAIIYPDDSGIATIAFMERVKHEKDKHSGQISFPGGQLEVNEGRKDGALRELEEEFGLSSDIVTIVGELTSLYIPVSNFQVYPFVGLINQRPYFRKDDQEVAAILEVNLSDLFKMKSTFTKTIQGQERRFPCFRVKEQIIWGATAMMLNELLEVIATLDNGELS